MLTIQLFGTPVVERDGQPLNITRRKSRALVYYLAASSRPVQREQLLALFWPDTDRVSAQQVLRTTLHGLRKQLDDGLDVERDAVGLAQGARVDARMFERNLSSPTNDVLKLETILGLYAGPFLEGFTLEDNPEYEQWLMAERERYQRMAVRTLVGLSHAHAATGSYQAALEALERGLALDPLQEDLQRETIRLAYLSGDRAGAIRRYDQLRRLLDEELGVPPMAETRKLYDQILNDSLPAPAPVAAAAVPASRPSARADAPQALPFSSRAGELRMLESEIFSGRLLLVEGEPGIGKTRLVEHFLAGLEGAVCLRGAGRELESSLPYQPVVEALRGLPSQPQGVELLNRARRGVAPVWLGEAARLLPELSTGSGGTTDEWRLWEGVRQLLVALAQQRPVVLFLDDLQWADSSSLGLLGYLARNLAPAPQIGLVAASWPAITGSPHQALTVSLDRAGLLRRIPLSRFSAEEVAQTVERLAGPNQRLARWLYEHSEGNLYILAQLVRQARERDWLQAGGESVADTQPEVPGAVYSLIQARLGRLSDAGRRVVDTAVAVGRDFDFDLVARASGLSEDAALDGLDELLAAGLVHAAGAGTLYRFDHSLTMEVAYREVGEARHRQLHRHVAEAMKLVYRYRPPENLDGLLAFHYAEGNQPERAAPHALRAGEKAVALAAWQQAAAFFQQALLGIEPDERCPVLMRLGLAQARSGKLAQAEETYLQALDAARAAGDHGGIDAARLQLAQTHLLQARFDDVIDQTRAVLEEGLPQNALLAELWWGTALSLEGADLEQAAEHLNRAVYLSRASSDREALAQVEFELGSLWAQRGDLPQAVDHYRAALRVAEEADTPVLIERRTLAHNNLAYHLLLLGEPGAEEHALRGMRLAQENGLLSLQPYLYSTQGEIALAARDWDAAHSSFTHGLELAQRLGIPERVAGLTANLGLLERERGRHGEALELLSAARAAADEHGLHHLAAQVRIWLAPLLPRADALAQLDEARAIARRGDRQRLLEEEQSTRRAVESVKNTHKP